MIKLKFNLPKVIITKETFEIRLQRTRDWLYFLWLDIRDFSRVFYYYLEKRLYFFGKQFEQQKSIVVGFLVAKRGTYQRPFLHTSLLIIIAAGVIGGPVIEESYSNANESLDDFTPPSAVISSLDAEEFSTLTQISEKPRDRVVKYSVKDGDTLSSIADKFGVSMDTIRWSNGSFKGEKLKIDQSLNIPPVTGLVVKISRGDTVYSLAKKHQTGAQKIANFPFNDFKDLDTFALVAGQSLVIPDGVPPRAAPIYRPQAIPEVVAGGSGTFAWPAQGRITQNPVSYHMAIDIANKNAPPIGAADTGVVSYVEYGRYGYGLHVIIDHSDGTQTLYAHLSAIYVKTGDRIGRGVALGKMGSSGRSTGTHLHFEVRRGGRIVNPYPYLQ